eukprot:Pgem_evm1s4242
MITTSKKSEDGKIESRRVFLSTKASRLVCFDRLLPVKNLKMEKLNLEGYFCQLRHLDWCVLTDLY